jgi:hypothetical protein
MEENTLTEAAPAAGATPPAGNVEAAGAPQSAGEDALEGWAQPETFDPASSGEEVKRKSVVLYLKMRRPGWGKKISATQLLEEANAGIITALTEQQAKQLAADAEAGRLDPAKIHVWQDKIDPKTPELDAIWKLDKEIYNWIKDEVSLSYKFLPPSHRLIPLSRVAEVDARITEYKARREELIAAVEPVWPIICERGKAGRGNFVSLEDYPAFREVKKRYKVEVGWKSYDAPASLASISDEMMQREKDRVAQEWVDTATEVRTALRTGFTGLVEKLATELGVDEETGKKRRLQSSTVRDMVKFLNSFDHNNMTGDRDLAAVVAQARALMEGVDVEQVKKQPALRDSLEKAFTSLTTEVKQHVVVGERRFRDYLEDDEEESEGDVESPEEAVSAESLMEEARQLHASGAAQPTDEWYEKAEDFLGVNTVR